MNSIRKWFYRPRRDDRSLLAQFYFADEGLNLVAGELDSFDGRKDPERCTALVNQLRQCQDRVLNICVEMMDELLPGERASRDFRVKFPDDVMQENLSGQLWFGAECLAAGNSILNRETESNHMRPLAKAVTKTIENVRNLLREQCLKPIHENLEHIRESLKIFDHFFADFELSYVSAMVPVKSVEEHDMQENVIVMFSETLQRALKIGLVTQEQVDNYDPVLMFTIPRLAIVCGLIIYPDGPLCLEKDSRNVSELFRPFKTLLHKIRELLWTMTTQELSTLEKCLCSMEEPDISLQNLRQEETLPPSAYGALAHTSEFVQRFYSSYPSCRQLTPELTGFCSIGKKVERLDRKRERASGKSSRTRARQERQNEKFLSRLTGMDERPRARRRSRRGTSNHQHREHLPQPWTGGYYPPFDRRRQYAHHYNDAYRIAQNHVYFRNPNGANEQVPHYPVRRNTPYCSAPYNGERLSTILCDCGANRSINQIPHAVIEGSTPPERDNESFAANFSPCTFYTHPEYFGDHLEVRNREGFGNASDYNGYTMRESTYMNFENGVVEMDRNTTAANIQDCVSNVVSADPSLLSPFSFYEHEFADHNSTHRLELEALTSDLSHMNVDFLPRDPNCVSCNMMVCCCSNSDATPQEATQCHVKPSDGKIVEKCCAGEKRSGGSCDPNSPASAPVPSARSIRTTLRPYGSVDPRNTDPRSEGNSYSNVSKTSAIDISDDALTGECFEGVPRIDNDGGSSGSTSPHHSGTEDDEEVALALQAAEVAATWKVRAKFSDPRDLIHRLFVCIAGVADQLQTNHASDLRKILKTVFLLNQTPDEEEEEEEEEKDDDTFLEEVGKEELSTTNDSEHLSVESAEDALVAIGTPDAHRSISPDEVADLDDDFLLQESCGRSSSNAIRDVNEAAILVCGEDTTPAEEISTENELSETLDEPEDLSGQRDPSDCLSKSGGSSCEEETPYNGPPSLALGEGAHSYVGSDGDSSKDFSGLEPEETGAPASSSSSSSSDAINRRRTFVQDPPTWVPDDFAPRCMACRASFTVVRRRHHCRNCGKVFCGHCSRHSVPLPHFGIWKNVRVCNSCFLYYVTTSADGSAALS